MFDAGTRLPALSVNGRVAKDGVSIPSAVIVAIVEIALLSAPIKMLGQHGGGGGRGTSSGPSAGPNTPYGVSTKDDLKTFHQILAVQATAQQKAMFAIIMQDVQAASDKLKAFQELQPKISVPAERSAGATALDQAIAKARAENQRFLASFSPAQKSGLKDITKKLLKADSDLDKQTQELDQIVQAPKVDEQIANSTTSLDKALDTFQSTQLALGDEMSIVLPSAGPDLTFSLAAVTNSIDLAGETISIPASGTLSRTSAEDGHNLFNLKLTADLSDLQREITGLLRSQLNRSPRCGERIEIQQATLTPLIPASLVVVHLHFERWFCQPGQAWIIPTELTEGEGSIEIKFIPSVEKDVGLRLVSETGRVEADGFLRDLLQSGDLGNTLREQIAASLLSAMQTGTDLKLMLPPVAQGSATIQKAQFQDDSAGRLSLILDGQMQFSDEQTKQLATQLKQRISAQQTSP
jgi:hypothetical protein